MAASSYTKERRMAKKQILRYSLSAGAEMHSSVEQEGSQVGGDEHPLDEAFPA